MDLFRNLPLLGILRGIREDEIDFIADIAGKEGLTALEITMNTKGAPRLIQRMKAAAQDRFAVGAGTVLSMADLHLALDADASFVVMPALIADVTDYCAKSNIPVFPGALTPQEIFNAWNAGATMVKVFPSNVFGPSYFQDIKGPFDNISLMACGSVTRENLGEFFFSGASAASFGGSIFQREWIEKRDDASISTALHDLICAFENRRRM